MQNASERLVKRRSLEIAKVRTTVAGTNQESTEKQQGDELDKWSSYQRKRLYKAAGLTTKVEISGDHSLAIKSGMGLNYYQMRFARRLLKPFVVHFENEISERKRRNTILNDHSKAAMNDCVQKRKTKKIKTVQRPLMYVSDICKFVLYHLDEMNGQGLLNDRDCTIPPGEIWVKIGADHGGESLNVYLQF